MFAFLVSGFLSISGSGILEFGFVFSGFGVLFFVLNFWISGFVILDLGFGISHASHVASTSTPDPNSLICFTIYVKTRSASAFSRRSNHRLVLLKNFMEVTQLLEVLEFMRVMSWVIMKVM